MKLWDNLIIGAGVSGLVLAQRLKMKGQEVLVIEKSKSVGGRMATRRDEEATFDHGAQYISSRIENYFDKQTLYPWIERNAEQKFSVRGGINKAAKYLSQGLEIQFNERAISVQRRDDIFIVKLEGATTILARKTFITCPVPQAIDLLKAGEIPYPQDLDGIVYDKALVGLFQVESPLRAIQNITYEENTGSGILSLSNQQSKLVSSHLAFTVIMTPKFSDTYFENDDTGSLFLIENCLLSFLRLKFNINETDIKIVRSQLKKWRYSQPRKVYEKHFIQLENNGLVLLGDGFAGGTLESAVQTALAVPI